jgi:hypothetical protein
MKKILIGIILSLCILCMSVWFLKFEVPSSMAVGLKSSSQLNQLGIKTGDSILRVNSARVDNFDSVKNEVEKINTNLPINLDFINQYTNQIISVAIPPLSAVNADQYYKLENLGIENSHLYIGCKSFFSLASDLNIETYDRLLMIQGIPASDFLKNENQMQKILDMIQTEKMILLSVVRHNQVVQLIRQKIKIDHRNTLKGSQIEQLHQFLGTKPLPQMFDIKYINLTQSQKYYLLLLNGWVCGKNK